MKFRLLILLLFFSGTASSDDAEEQSADNQSPKKGNEIWLEEKISPTTTWIENLVEPLTTWMERKINAPEGKADDSDDSQPNEQEGSLEPKPTEPDDTADIGPSIGSKQAGALAKNHIAGDVLYIKLMEKTNQYRVKLISKLGEIHIIYVDAVSGEIISRSNKSGAQATQQIGTTLQDRVSETVDKSNTNVQEKP